MEEHTVRLFFSFRSPYSYLVAARAFDLPDKYNVDIEWCGVRPMVTRGVPLSPQKQMYIMRDCYRIAKKLDIPFGKIKDPLGDGAIRCLNVAEYADDEGKLAEFVLGATRGIWSEGKEVAADEPLKEICESAGLDWDGCRAAIDNPDYTNRIENNIALLGALGHWGVPTFELDGELYWGQDRFDYLCRDLDDIGLAKT